MNVAINTIAQALATFGFPTVMVIYLLWNNYKKDKQIAYMNKDNQALIKENTAVMTKLVMLIEGRTQ